MTYQMIAFFGFPIVTVLFVIVLVIYAQAKMNFKESSSTLQRDILRLYKEYFHFLYLMANTAQNRFAESREEERSHFNDLYECVAYEPSSSTLNEQKENIEEILKKILGDREDALVPILWENIYRVRSLGRGYLLKGGTIYDVPRTVGGLQARAVIEGMFAETELYH